jgi:hypothetical protein
MYLGPAKCSDLKSMECERNSLEFQRKFVGQEVHFENGDRLASYQRIGTQHVRSRIAVFLSLLFWQRTERAARRERLIKGHQTASAQ